MTENTCQRSLSHKSAERKKDILRPKNFLVRVFVNGDDKRFAYCATCTLDIILQEATRKLSLIKPAQRLFDFTGREIYRSEDIKLGSDYYVSMGQDFRNPLKNIRDRFYHELYSEWTIHGIRHTCCQTKGQTRRVKRIVSSESSSPERLPKFIYYDKETLTDMNLPQSSYSKEVQTTNDSCDRYTQITIYHDNQNTQTDVKVGSNIHKSVQATTFFQHKDTQVVLNGLDRESQTDVQMCISSEHKDIQVKPDGQNKSIQTTPQYETKETQIISSSAHKNLQTDLSREISHSEKATNTETMIQMRNSNGLEDLNSPKSKSVQSRRIDHRSNAIRPSSARPDFRDTQTTNFRVRVYRNGERRQFAYCKSCSMDIILSAATNKLQMTIPARRLFDANGNEIFDSREIRRDKEYFVSSGANFKVPLNQ